MSDPGEISIDNSLHLDDEMSNGEGNKNIPGAEHPNSDQDETRYSPAQTLIELAAYRIDIQPSKLKHLLHIMKEELITEVWQLHYLDSANWKDMGFPTGLVASIRRLLHEKEMAGSANESQDKDYGFKDSAGQFAGHVTFQGIPPNYSNSMRSTINRKNTDCTEDDDYVSATGPEIPIVPSGVPVKGSVISDEVAAGRFTVMRRISDITMSERLTNRMMPPGMLLSPPKVSKPAIFGTSSGSQIASRVSTIKDQPPVSAPRRSSRTNRERHHSPTPSESRSSGSSRNNNQRTQKQCPRTSMPLRPLRRPTLHDTQNMTKLGLDIDDLSDTADSFAMESVGMLIVGSKQDGKEKVVDHNSSMAVVTSFNDLGKYLDGADSTIDEVAENESKLSDGSHDIQDPSMSTRSKTLAYNARLMHQTG